MKLPECVTANFLRAQDAIVTGDSERPHVKPEALGKFMRRWPNGMEFTGENAAIARRMGVDLGFLLGHCLPDAHRAQFAEHRQRAWDTYLTDTAFGFASIWRKAHREKTDE